MFAPGRHAQIVFVQIHGLGKERPEASRQIIIATEEQCGSRIPAHNLHVGQRMLDSNAGSPQRSVAVREWIHVQRRRITAPSAHTYRLAARVQLTIASRAPESRSATSGRTTRGPPKGGPLYRDRTRHSSETDSAKSRLPSPEVIITLALVAARRHAAFLETVVRSCMGRGRCVRAFQTGLCRREPHGGRVERAFRKDIPRLRLLLGSKGREVVEIVIACHKTPPCRCR